MKHSTDSQETLELIQTVSTELTIKRSRFLGRLEPAANRDSVTASLQTLQTNHASASHIVYAFLIGPPNSEVAGVTDAGEPHGTAGRPVMDVLRGSGIRNVLATVVRYFGGTKLGTGGLVRAYGDTARALVEAATTRPLIERSELDVEIEYQFLDGLLPRIEAASGRVTGQAYAERVRLLIEIPTRDAELLVQEITDYTAGSALIDGNKPGDYSL